MQELYELKDKLMKNLCEYAAKDKLDMPALQQIDTLAHALKNVCKIIRDYEMDGNYSNAAPYYREDMSYRNRNAMGQYARDGGYSPNGYSSGMMNQPPNDYVRQKMYDAMRGM